MEIVAGTLPTFSSPLPTPTSASDPWHQITASYESTYWNSGGNAVDAKDQDVHKPAGPKEAGTHTEQLPTVSSGLRPTSNAY